MRWPTPTRSRSHADEPIRLPGLAFRPVLARSVGVDRNDGSVVRSLVNTRETPGPGEATTSTAGQRHDGSADGAANPTEEAGSEQDPEHGLQHALRGADLTAQGAPTPTGSPGESAHSTAGRQPAQSKGAVRALAEWTLVARAQDGDLAAFEQLVRAYEPELVRLGYRMLSDVGEAQDAVQDTLLVAWRKLPSVVDPAAFHAWIYQLMTRRCLNLLRQRARRRATVVSDDDLQRSQQAHPTPVDQDVPADQAQNRAIRDSLTMALRTLPAELRACWVLHSLHDLSYPEIAYAIGVPVSTVRGRVARARAQLAKGMSAWQ